MEDGKSQGVVGYDIQTTSMASEWRDYDGIYLYPKKNTKLFIWRKWNENEGRV